MNDAQRVEERVTLYDAIIEWPDGRTWSSVGHEYAADAWTELVMERRRAEEAVDPNDEEDNYSATAAKLIAVTGVVDLLQTEGATQMRASWLHCMALEFDMSDDGVGAVTGPDTVDESVQVTYRVTR